MIILVLFSLCTIKAANATPMGLGSTVGESYFPLQGSTEPVAVTTGCPASVDSRDLTLTRIDDFTEHTFVTRAGPRGSIATCTVTRVFARPIVSIQLMIVGGRADDIGFVGGTQVTSAPQACADVGTVVTPIDVTHEVTVTGNSASFVLSAQENCCCATGWGQLTQGDRANARFRWIVTLGSEEFEIKFSAFIPANFVIGPPQSICINHEVSPLDPRRHKRLIFKGDDRSFDPDGESHRARQVVTVITERSVDEDGLKSSARFINRAEGSEAYTEEAFDDGFIGPDDDDGVLGDCFLLHARSFATSAGLQIQVIRTGDHEVKIHLTGAARNQLVQPSAAIDWNLILTLTSQADGSTRWSLEGDHDGFPAYEIYINNEAIYTHFPGAPPYTFTHLRRLFPPEEVNVRLSGSLSQ
jgi:hypothetical protein